jgi:hypothetical protein
MQTMRMRLQNYNINIVHKAGKEMYLSDTLSRLETTDMTARNLFDDDLGVASVKMSISKVAEIMHEINNDTTLTKLKENVCEGWSEDND